MKSEYYTIKKLPSIKEVKQWKVSRFIDNTFPVDISIVSYNEQTDRWKSDDIGFIRHENSNTNKRIRLVKEFIEQKEIDNSIYWFDNGDIKFFNL